MKLLFFNTLFITCQWAFPVYAQAQNPVVRQEAVDKPEEKDRRADAERAEHRIQPNDLVNAGLTSLEHDLSKATTLHDTDGLVTCLKLLEQFWAQSVATHDVEAISRIEADDFVCTDPSGAVTHKPDDLEAAKSGALQVADFKLEDVKVNLYSDAAVLTGKTTFSGTAHGEAYGGSYRWADVFVAHNGRWQVAISQATNIASPDSPPPTAPSSQAADHAVACPVCGMPADQCKDEKSAPPVVDDEAALEKLEQDWGDAIQRHDAGFLERLEADGYTYTGPDGAISHKADDIAGARAGFARIDSFKHRDLKIQVYGESAVVTGATTLKATAGDADISGDFRWTDVFVKHGGQWQVVASQATAISRAAAED